MENFVVIRAKRILSRLSNYQEVSQEYKNVTYVKDIPLQKDEFVVGTYENLPGDTNETIIVTNLGLYVFRIERWEHINYAEIARVEMPKNKEGAETLIIHLLNDIIIDLPVKGGKGKFRDLFEFTRFLDRIISDIRSET